MARIDGVLERAGATLPYVIRGSGDPVVFQHGLGGDLAQCAETFPDDLLPHDHPATFGRPAFRRISLLCRGHGGGSDAEEDRFGFAVFAEDILALCDGLGVARAAFGGVSMGAALAMRIGATEPERVRALILVRPAWHDAPAPDTLAPFRHVAGLIETLSPDDAERALRDGPIGLDLARRSPDNLASLVATIRRPDRARIARLAKAVGADGPGVDEAGMRAIAAPTLVIGCAEDVVHPLAIAERQAAIIPGARFVEVPPKGRDRAAHFAATRAAISDFLAALPPEPLSPRGDPR
jgi:pimeloyl-ACP methyl ester carboxylesterase